MSERDKPDDSFSNKPKLEPDDFYYSPEGYIVFTAKYLLKRGYCCKNGCKHCPYGYNVKTGKFDKN
ncbi:MAG TPA: DUF5522 domain-containing protein [Flavobacteriales bacterium]|nr:DUF5522 domain-containing protein [Flavobacteriales bacterium]